MPRMNPTESKPRLDPRLYQITVLAALLVYGFARLHFEIQPLQAFLTLAVTLGTQALCTWLFRPPAAPPGAAPAPTPKFDPKSALISGLSLCLLLRTNSMALVVLAAIVAIASKFVLRWNGKHVFNPTNFGIVALMLATGQAWVSPGQWGSVAFFAFLMACLGGLVVHRAARSDVTFAFLVSFLAIQFGYAAHLGQPLAIPLHRLANGAFLLFTFFMISDPRTTPDSRAGRILFAVLVAAGAAWIQLGMFRTNGLLWSLALCSLLVPLIDRWLPGSRYQWTSRTSRSAAPEKGAGRETNGLVLRPGGARAAYTRA